jgi:hypothetical protein
MKVMRSWKILVLGLILASSGCLSDSENNKHLEESFHDIDLEDPKSVARHAVTGFDSWEDTVMLTHEESEYRGQREAIIEQIDGNMSVNHSTEIKDTRELELGNHSYKLNKSLLDENITSLSDFIDVTEEELGYKLSEGKISLIDIIIDERNSLNASSDQYETSSDNIYRYATYPNIYRIEKSGVSYILAQKKGSKEWRIIGKSSVPTRTYKSENPDEEIEIKADYKYPDFNTSDTGGIEPKKIEINKGDELQLNLKSKGKYRHRLIIPSQFIGTRKVNSSAYLHHQFTQKGKYDYMVVMGDPSDCYSLPKMYTVSKTCNDYRVKRGKIIVN